MTPILIASLAALAVSLGAYAVWTYVFEILPERRGLRQRLDQKTQAPAPAPAEDPTADILRTKTLSSVPSVNALLERFSVSAQLERLLEQAGLKISVANLLYLMATLAAVTALVMEFEFPTAPPIEVATALGVGLVLPLAYVVQRRKKRFQAFAEQFPAALDMIRSSVHAGHSLNYALEVSTDELPEPIASELRTVLEEMRLGLSARDALENMTRRIPIAELRFFMLAVVLTREVGGNLSEVLGTLASTLRERSKLRQKVRALSAQGRSSAMMLIGLPVAVGFLTSFVSPGFMNPLWEHPLGRQCLAVAIALQVAGWMLVKRICNPKELRLS
jgi:tight adherence protein B